MKLNPIATNQTEVELASGVVVFFSYKTPVAAYIPGRGYIQTNYRWSKTTTGHINKWLKDAGEVKTVPQSEIDGLV